MAKGIARYNVTWGLSGCFLPDDVETLEFRTRRDLVSFVEDELARLEWPRLVRRQVKLSNIWRHVKRYGSSVAHFSFEHKGYELAFAGLTDDEYRRLSDADA